MSFTAYARARTIAELPRASEARLLSQITGELIRARDAGQRGASLIATLHRNREAWGIFTATCAASGNGLPDALRAQIISLGLWVDRHTSLVMRDSGALDDLISVNRAIIEGLSTIGTTAQAAA